jgi:DHA1 family bicyclomycin/chloramphenicol resistance-like MFS transporter
MNNLPTPSKAEYYRLGILLGGLTAMGPLAIDMYLPSFPTIADELGTSTAAVQVTAATYFFGLAFGQAFYGSVSDRLGRKIPLYFGLSLFIVASIGCALATSVEALAVMRFIQALGGCAEMVVARAVVRDRFDERDSIRVLSLLLLVMGIAPILAPSIGGQLLIRFGWRSVFWLLAGYGVLGLVAVAVRLPETLPLAQRQRHSLGRQIRIYGELLRDRHYMAYVLSGSLIISGMFAYIVGSPLVFIELFGVAPERYGLFFGTNAFGLIAASQVNGRLARRIDPRRILRVVLPVTAVAGLVLLASTVTGVGGFAGVLVPLFAFVSSLGFILPNTTVLAMAPHGSVAGSASALLGTVQFFVGAVAGALVGILANGTAIPLGGVIAVCGVSAVVIYARVDGPTPPPAMPRGTDGTSPVATAVTATVAVTTTRAASE